MPERTIYCCGCGHDVAARLTDGSEVYPHREDLDSLPFWKCDTCNNFVGCHHRHHHADKRENPLGVIATQEIKEARKHIHKILDPLWKPKPKKRKAIYKQISDRLGYEYHTAEIRSIDEARKIYRIVKDIANDS